MVKKLQNFLKNNKKTFLTIFFVILIIFAIIKLIPFIKGVIILLVFGGICGGFCTRR
mgnify:CR=1 FL=1